MKAFKLLVLTTLIIPLVLSSCDNDDGPQLPEGVYSFKNISENNEIFAFERRGLEAVEIPQEEVDMSRFDECSQVHIIDEITILSDSRLSYRAFNRWIDLNETQIKESDYSITGNVLEFTHIDEFSNESKMTMQVEDEQLILYTYVIVEQWLGNWIDPEFHSHQTNQIIDESDALNRLSGDEGDQVYYMLYEQRYSQ